MLVTLRSTFNLLRLSSCVTTVLICFRSSLYFLRFNEYDLSEFLSSNWVSSLINLKVVLVLSCWLVLAISAFTSYPDSTDYNLLLKLHPSLMHQDYLFP